MTLLITEEELGKNIESRDNVHENYYFFLYPFSYQFKNKSVHVIILHSISVLLILKYIID